MINSIEAMHLLPQSFEFQTPTPPPRDVCRNSDTPPPSRCSVLFEKPAAPPPAPGFFVLAQFLLEIDIVLGSLPSAPRFKGESVTPGKRTERLNAYP
jgi:hypothetical protein